MIILDTNLISEPLRPDPEPRVLPFDLDCTSAYARLLAKTRKTGQAIATADAFIAAIAKTHGFAIATRDTAPFQTPGLTVINPWNLA